MLRSSSQITVVTLALLVGVLAVAAPWTPLCAQMLSGSSPSGMASCETVPGERLSAECAEMGTPGTPTTAVAVSKAPSVPDITAVTVASIDLPALSVVRAAIEPPMDDPPRLVLDTSRLRI